MINRDGLPPPKARTQAVLVVTLWLAGLGAAAQYGKVAAVYDLMPSIYPDAGAALGWAVSLVGVVGILLGVVAGVVVTQVGLRRALIVGLLGGAVLSGLQALSPPFWAFLGLRVIEGIFHLAIVVAAPTLISQVSAPRHRGLTLTLWGTFFGVAFALIAAFGVPFAHLYGLPALFGAHGVWMLVFAVVLAIMLPRDPVGQGDGASAGLDLGRVLAQSARLYRSPSVGAPAWGWLFYTFSFVSLLTLIPQFLDPGIRVATLTAMPLVSIAMSMGPGVLMLRVMSPVTVVQIGFVGAALCVLTLLLFPGNPAICLAAAAALGLVQGASFAAVPELNAAPADRALANGGLAQMGNLGNTFGVPLLAGGIAAGGLPGLVVPLAVALGTGAVVHALLARRRRGERARDRAG